VPADVMRLVAARRVALAGVVTDGGAPVAGATVALDSDALYGAREVTTDAAGKFAFAELPEGSYRVWAWRGERAARALRVPRLGRGPFADVALALEPAAIIVGRVVDRQTGAGLAAAVTLSADAADEAPRHARTDADGRFRVEGVPPGPWTAAAWAPGWLLAGTVSFTPGRGELTLELIPGGVVEGRVVDDTGAPIAGAVVTATGRGGGLEISAAGADEQLRRGARPGGAPGDRGRAAGGRRAVRRARRAGRDAGPDPVRAATRRGPHHRRDADRRRRPRGRSRHPGGAAADRSRVRADLDHRRRRAVPPDRPAGGWLRAGRRGAGLRDRPRRADHAGARADRRRRRAGAARAARWSPGGSAISAARRWAARIVRFAPAEPLGSRGVVEVATDADGRYRAGPLAGAQAVSARAWGHGDFAGVLDVKRPADGADVAYDITLVVADPPSSRVSSRIPPGCRWSARASRSTRAPARAEPPSPAPAGASA
jgi:hypothetical protein